MEKQLYDAHTYTHTRTHVVLSNREAALMSGEEGGGGENMVRGARRERERGGVEGG